MTGKNDLSLSFEEMEDLTTKRFYANQKMESDTAAWGTYVLVILLKNLMTDFNEIIRRGSV